MTRHHQVCNDVIYCAFIVTVLLQFKEANHHSIFAIMMEMRYDSLDLYSVLTHTLFSQEEVKQPYQEYRED